MRTQETVLWAAFVVMPSGHRRGDALGTILRDDVGYVRYLAGRWPSPEIRAAAALLLDYIGEPAAEGLAEDLQAVAIAAARSERDAP